MAYITVIDAEMCEVWQYKLPEEEKEEDFDYEEFVRIDKGHGSSCDWLVHEHSGVKTD